MDSDPTAAFPELAGPRRALSERVARYDDALARSLLAVVDRLAALREVLLGTPTLELVHASAQALAGAARLISFSASAADREVPLHPHAFGATPTRPEGPLLADARQVLGSPAGPAGALGRTLLDQLEELLRDVIFSADAQGFVDASANEAAYLRAATLLSRSAALVAAACR